MYEKALVLSHNNFTATEWEVPQIKSDKEYGIIEIEESKKYINNEKLNEFRLNRFEEYKKIGFPKWKRAKLNGFDPLPYRPKINSLISENLKSLNDLDDEGILILKDMDFDGSHRKFLLMSDIFFNSGFYLKTSNKQENEIYTVETIIDKDNPLYDLGIINLEENSKATLIRFVKSNGNSSKIASLRGKLKKNSELTIININLFNNDISTDNIFFDIGENAKLTMYDINIGGKVNAPHIVIRMANKEGNVNIYPYYLTQDEEIIDMFYLIRYYAPKTFGHILGHGVLMDSSRVIFRGNLDIKKGAKDADAGEQDFNLILSDKARVMAYPSLYVDENDVNAGHAASIGSIEEEQLYYMMTRGYSKSEAKKEIASGIFEPAISFVEQYNSKIVGELRDVIQKRFDREFSNS
ncbi:Iron-regulated ABC transporter permease protein SufD [Marinitoga hydrogenitolerans DSM 16785]|uniref:Iron-regulated ABC transporter permease protein SufD n=1 Tax=Marinitoga hydrogenitolerans (strain DSM 16785 / JCM 12826 / AT1271) TaxID=1122195 RepID=A0A1M4TI48_MARH1|nr:SufD family Fe-S cluster assembly protein [Marinitoga hydrogenitolerans]SHE44172.1 Iron-regulated ABC transporter permease protein SufD [Marinitoga hydrogenitolerans DSM 16785]